MLLSTCQVWLFAVVCVCKYLQLLGWELRCSVVSLACFMVKDETSVEVISGPGCDQLVRGLGGWTAACKLAPLLWMFPGTHTHLTLPDMLVCQSQGGCAVPILSLTVRSWAPLTAVCWQLLWWLT